MKIGIGTGLGHRRRRSGGAAALPGAVQLSAPPSGASVPMPALASALALVLAAPATENPSAFSRGSLESVNVTTCLSPAQPTTHARILTHQVRQGAASTTVDVTVTVTDGGDRTRLLVYLCWGPIAEALTSVTLDPGGLNIALAPVTDGVTTSLVTGASTRGQWRTSIATVPPGNYTLRIIKPTGTIPVGVHWFEIENTPRVSINALGVTNVVGVTNSGTASGSVTGLADGLILMGTLGTGGGYSPDNSGAVLPSIAGVQAAPYGDSRNGSEARLSAAFVGRAQAGANAVSMSSLSTTLVASLSSTVHLTAISLGYEAAPVAASDDTNCMHHGAN